MQFNAAPEKHREKGVIGWVSFDIYESFRVNAVVVKENREGHVSLSYPANKSPDGTLHHYVRPLNNETRLQVEDEILGVLGYGGEDESTEGTEKE